MVDVAVIVPEIAALEWTPNIGYVEQMVWVVVVSTAEEGKLGPEGWW